MVFLWIVSSIFCPCPSQKNDKFSAWSGDLVDVEDGTFEVVKHCQSYGVGKLFTAL